MQKIDTDACFEKLSINMLKHVWFVRWVNRKDPEGKNIFAGGFLGLDNIGVFDRSKPLPTGGFLEQVSPQLVTILATLL